MAPQTCHHCGNEWNSRKEKPKKCPRCANSLWRSPRPKRQAVVMANEIPEELGIFDPDHPDMADEVANVRDALSDMKSRAEELFKRLQA